MQDTERLGWRSKYLISIAKPGSKYKAGFKTYQSTAISNNIKDSLELSYSSRVFHAQPGSLILKTV